MALARESFLGGQHRNAISTPAARVVFGQQKCADFKSLIRVSPQSLTEDPHLQTLVIRNLESAVRPHLNATLIYYSPVQFHGRKQKWVFFTETLAYYFNLNGTEYEKYLEQSTYYAYHQCDLHRSTIMYSSLRMNVCHCRKQ